MGLGVALKAFSAALFDREAAQRIRQAIEGPPKLDARELTPIPTDRAGDEAELVAAAKPAVSPRSEAVTLLSALQREARLLDLIQEDLVNFSDDQIGAAARPCLQSCREVLDRTLAPSPLCESGEGASVEIPANASPATFQRIGEGEAARGTLIHAGWRVTKSDLPRWTGRADDADVIAPAQVQI